MHGVVNLGEEWADRSLHFNVLTMFQAPNNERINYLELVVVVVGLSLRLELSRKCYVFKTQENIGLTFIATKWLQQWVSFSFYASICPHEVSCIWRTLHVVLLCYGWYARERGNRVCVWGVGSRGNRVGGDRASCIVLFLKVLFLLMVHDIYVLTKTDGSKANLLSVNSTNTGGMQKQFMKWTNIYLL